MPHPIGVAHPLQPRDFAIERRVESQMPRYGSNALRWSGLRVSIAVCLVGCGVAPVRPTTGSPVETTASEDLSIPMRDGVRLSATRFFLDDGRPHPTILIRTPYGKGAAHLELLSAGYDVVCEDVRGRGSSQGQWRPMLDERRDGYDTVEWIAKQRWSTGKVGMIGESYMGFVQWAAAAERPPHLACIVPIVSPPDPYQNLPYENGCFLEAVALWYTGIIGRATPEPGARPKRSIDAFLTWPVIDADVALHGSKNNAYREWVRRENPGDWKEAETVADAAASGIPSFSVSGWFDGDQIGTELRWAAGKGDRRWMIYGPWGHEQTSAPRIGDREIQSQNGPNVRRLETEFLDYFLKGGADTILREPRVQAFALGSNRWYRSNAWPPRSRTVVVQLAADGSLSEAGQAGCSTYEMDPAHIRGTRHLMANPGDDTSPYWLDPVDLPYGHLVFHGERLRQKEEVCGPFHAHIVFSVDTPDVDVFVQPMDEAPDGRLLPLGQGGRARARKVLGLSRLEAQRRYALDVRCWETLAEVPAGHRVSLLVSSDRFPVYSVNSNSAEPMAIATHLMKAHVQIQSDSTFSYGVVAR